jgi:uncharacterized protein YlzI (FlbEa/FlbD family)
MQEIVVKRVWIETDELASDILRYNSLGIHPSDIHYYEEYVGKGLEDYTREPIVTIHLYNGEAICISDTFKKFHKKILDYRNDINQNRIFNNN